MFSSCVKDNLDSTTTEEEEVTPEVVLCNLETTIEQTATGLWAANVTGGTAPFTYQWSTGETTSSILINASGTYSVTVTDAEGCVVEATVDITINDPCQSFSLTIDENPTGELTANVSGGTAPYSFLWSTGETSSSIISMGNGTYSVTVTDAEGCVLSDSVTISGSDPCNSLTGSIGEQPPGTGMLWAAVGGGTAPYTYLWSTGETTSNITVTTDGIYTVTVTDGQGCVIVLTINVSLSGGPCQGFSTEIQQNASGALTADVNGGSPAYTYSWSTGETTSSIMVNTTGTFSVTVTDSQGCVAVDDIQL